MWRKYTRLQSDLAWQRPPLCEWRYRAGNRSQQTPAAHHCRISCEACYRLLRTLRSTTQVRNTGQLPIPIRWFPHPFFPHIETDELCRLNIPVSIPADASYQLAQSGFIARKGWPWTDGHFLALDHAAQTNVVVLQKHPLLGLVAATCSYIPSYFPIWGNRQTFSWEPFLERTIGAGQEFGWWIDYDF
jgi:hypothetical protein